MPVGRGGGGHGGRKKQGDCNSFILSCVQRAWPDFGASANQIIDNVLPPTHRHFVYSPVSLASRDKDSDLLNSTTDIYNLMKNRACEQSTVILTYQLSMGYHIGKYILRINIKIHLLLNPTHRTLENKDKILGLGLFETVVLGCKMHPSFLDNLAESLS